MNLQPGDIFLTNRGGFMSKCITAVNKFWAIDNDADYSHAGVIIGNNGETFESRSKIGRYNLSDFDGIPTLVGRHRLMTQARFERGMAAIWRYEGVAYPWWRIPLLLIPPVGKYISTGHYLVCSELASKFLWGAGLVETYKGWTPDNLADMVEHWKLWDIIKGE